jgi:hypothetical protein
MRLKSSPKSDPHVIVIVIEEGREQVYDKEKYREILLEQRQKD